MGQRLANDILESIDKSYDDQIDGLSKKGKIFRTR